MCLFLPCTTPVIYDLAVALCENHVVIMGILVFYTQCSPTLFYPNQNKHAMPLALIQGDEGSGSVAAIAHTADRQAIDVSSIGVQ